MLIVVKNRKSGFLTISEFSGIKQAENHYRKLYPDEFDSFEFIEATDYL